MLIILEKKAMHFLQAKQAKKYEGSVQVISLKKDSGKIQKFKVSIDFEKKDILQTLNKITQSNKITKKGSLQPDSPKKGLFHSNSQDDSKKFQHSYSMSVDNRLKQKKK